MKRRVLVFLLALCLAAALVPVTAFAGGGYTNIWDGSIASAFAGGTGTAENPYQIATGAQLAYLASSVNSGETYAGKNFVLTANIDLNKRPWTPIANTFSGVFLSGSVYRIFAGNLDGQGYTVSNVAIGSESDPFESDVFGLFGATEGKISNLHLNTVSIHGIAKDVPQLGIVSFAGGLVGYASGNVENCHVTGLTMTMTAPDSGFTAAYWIGGLVGISEAKQINECSASGKIAEKSGKGSIGGLIGELGKASKITYSRANVTLNVAANPKGGADVGGFIGKGNGKSDTETVIRNCYATGDVTGGAYAGGFAGGIWGLNIINCYATGNVSGAVASMASFAGTDASDTKYYGSIINCYATGEVTGKGARYAFFQQYGAERSKVENCYFSVVNSSLINQKNHCESAIAKTLDEMKTDSFADVLNAGDKSNGWVFVNGKALCGAEPADYSAIENALKTVPSDLTVYTDESVAALNKAIDGVIQGKAVVNQAAVDAMAKAIEDAITALEKKSVETTVQLPQTGDDSNLALWTALLLVSGAAICTMMAGKKKNYGK